MEKQKLRSGISKDEIAFQIEIRYTIERDYRLSGKIGDTVQIGMLLKARLTEKSCGSGYGGCCAEYCNVEDFEKGIVGMKAGEEKDIEVIFPEDYDNLPEEGCLSYHPV